MGATGWVRADGAEQMTAHVKLTADLIPKFADSAVRTRFAALFAFTGLLICLARNFHNPRTAPIVLAAAALTFAAACSCWATDARPLATGVLFDAGSPAPVPYALARWISGDKAAIEKFMLSNRTGMVDDVDGDPVFLASSAFMMRRTVEQNPDLGFRDIKDVRADMLAA